MLSVSSGLPDGHLLRHSPWEELRKHDQPRAKAKPTIGLTFGILTELQIAKHACRLDKRLARVELKVLPVA